MRWARPDRLPDIKTVIDRYHILDRIVNINVAKMWAAGTPCTYWRNSAVTKTGILPSNLTKCYCWSEQDAKTQVVGPDRRHFLCQGTGFLEGYQKYGYTDIVLSTPSNLEKSSANIIVSGERNSSYIISGASRTETLTSQEFKLSNFIKISFFLVNDKTDPNHNRIRYECLINNSQWMTIPVSGYTQSPIANGIGAIEYNAPIETIRFRIVFEKRTTNSPSPRWNSIRFRYQKQISLGEMDPRFKHITIPAFLAAREQQAIQVEQGEYGWTTKFPLEWWTLPDVDITNADVIMFLQGIYENYKFVTKNVREFVYGNSLKLLHKKFESIFIRDREDLLGIAHYLI